MRIVTFLILAGLLSCATRLRAQDVQWKSIATGLDLNGQVVAPPNQTDAFVATVVYLKGLSIPRLGTESDEAIIGDLAKAGQLVLVLDYQHHAKAVGPELAADV